ncbi:MAG TPA: hypothetical protein VGR12_00125, partial [Solirubrobacteraceae bacterium]|nr:hypothetical protein [Solirubrobacteraceae bacterium]
MAHGSSSHAEDTTARRTDGDELLRAAARGDRAALAALVDRHGELVFRYADLVCHAPRDAIAVTRATFEDALAGLRGEADGERSVGAVVGPGGPA